LQAALMVLPARELGTLRLWPVDKSVGTVRNHNPDLLLPAQDLLLSGPILSGPLLQRASGTAMTMGRLSLCPG
jgi:hypothetical protein